MSLQESLKEKSKSALPYGGAVSKQCEIVLVWQQDDTAAAKLCQQTGGGLAAKPYHLCPLEDGATTALRELLGILVQTGENDFLSARCYLLWVWIDTPPLALTSLQDEFGTLLAADCCTVGQGHTSPKTQGFRLEWRLDDSAANLDSVLMVFSMIGPAEMPALLLNMGTSSRVFHLSVILYNAVEQDLACRLRAHLEAVLEGSPDTQKQAFINSFSLTDSEKQAILRKLPHPEDLPILDAGTVCGQPEYRMKTLRSLFKPAQRYDSVHQPGDSFISDTLNRLFGQIGSSPCTEWLLDKALDALPGLCEDHLRRLGLEKQCYQQPLRFLLYKAPQLVLELRNRANDEQQLARRNCEQMLRDAINFPPDATYTAALKGLSPYLACWDRCLEHGLTAAWWDAVSKLIHREPIRSQAKCKFQELNQGITTLERLVWRQTPRTECVAPAGVIDWRYAAPDQLLNSLYSDEEFTDTELAHLAVTIQRNADSFCHATSFGATLLLFDEQIKDRLYRIRGPSGYEIFKTDGSCLLGRSYTGVLRGIPIPYLGRQTLWEVRIGTCEQP